MYARFSMNVMHGNSKALKATASVSPGKLGSFRKKPRRRFSPLLPWRLPKAHTGSVTVLVDETRPEADRN
jgi:hypothetical protein